MSATTQEDKFNVLLNWLMLFGINPNLDKLRRQVVCITHWMNRSCNGAIQAVTGFGKTYIGLFAIYLIQRTYPDFNVIIVVPSQKLFEDWSNHVRNFQLKNCKVYIVNSYTKEEFWNEKWTCDVLIADEGHRYLGKDSKYFSKVLEITVRKCTLVLSATLDDREKLKLMELNIPVVDTISMVEAKRMGYVSEYTVYNLAVTLPADQQEAYDKLHKWHNDMLGKFQFFPVIEDNYKLAVACGMANDAWAKVAGRSATGKEWREWYAEQMGWNGDKDHDWSPRKIATYSRAWQIAMVRRKSLLYKHPLKVETAVKILEYLNYPPTITFSENISVTEQLVSLMPGKAKAYHSDLETIVTDTYHVKHYKTLAAAKKFAKEHDSKVEPADGGGYNVQYKGIVKTAGANLKRSILTSFENKEFSVLCTAKALDEGFNVEGIEVAIVLSATSKQRQNIQRTGRAIRFIPDKSAKIINIYIQDTKDQDWLERRQKGETGIKWIQQIEQIPL